MNGNRNEVWYVLLLVQQTTLSEKGLQTLKSEPQREREHGHIYRTAQVAADTRGQTKNRPKTTPALHKQQKHEQQQQWCTHHLVVAVQLEAELPLFRLRPPQLRVAPQGFFRQLLLLVFDESFEGVHPLEKRGARSKISSDGRFPDRRAGGLTKQGAAGRFYSRLLGKTKKKSKRLTITSLTTGPFDAKGTRCLISLSSLPGLCKKRVGSFTCSVSQLCTCPTPVVRTAAANLTPLLPRRRAPGGATM